MSDVPTHCVNELFVIHKYFWFFLLHCLRRTSIEHCFYLFSFCHSIEILNRNRYLLHRMEHILCRTQKPFLSLSVCVGVGISCAALDVFCHLLFCWSELLVVSPVRSAQQKYLRFKCLPLWNRLVQYYLLFYFIIDRTHERMTSFLIWLEQNDRHLQNLNAWKSFDKWMSWKYDIFVCEKKCLQNLSLDSRQCFMFCSCVHGACHAWLLFRVSVAVINCVEIFQSWN